MSRSGNPAFRERSPSLPYRVGSACLAKRNGFNWYCDTQTFSSTLSGYRQWTFSSSSNHQAPYPPSTFGSQAGKGSLRLPSEILERASVFNSSILALRFSLPHDPVNQVTMASMVAIFHAPIRVDFPGNGETFSPSCSHLLMVGSIV
ncbi:hypothetical protein Sfum_2056 [Syntrophobacter fumaroxidans MPOB]|uniref:Uncharacterized protein n=1 Tax=Syntrophobacter fumaroxidans (strain DSM 10017 / MPOB) TaxID=335543 RepID=A0LJY7_SYNFM|nr:hypothetical protein Sfum_2056 [Syntrophobacter fumaroxidans MPOB]